MGLDRDAWAMYQDISERYDDDHGIDKSVVAQIQQHRLLCVDGPFDGAELDVPPNGTQVVINAAFGRKTGLRGPVVYEVQDTPAGKRLVFVGQPDQSDAIGEEMARRATENETGQLILP